MQWKLVNLTLLTLLMSFKMFGEQKDNHALADHCPANYEEARQAFRNAANKNKYITQQKAFYIDVKGPGQADLSIDLAVMGNIREANKILFHISGTHGVEGGPGSGIQHEFLSNPAILAQDTAIIFIHVLNPFGMAWNRRVNELNIDLNRNCTEQRITSDLYPLFDPLFNPNSPIPWDLTLCQKLSSLYGWPLIRKTLLEGQYHFPEGLFYGGKEITSGIRTILKWCEDELSSLAFKARDIYFGIIDVHSGLGPYGIDTLITIEPPTEIMLNFFGDKMSMAVQMANIGYKATGCFVEELVNCLRKITKCPLPHIFVVGQEFGTLKEEDVLLALYNENALFHYKQRLSLLYDPNEKAGQDMLKAFYPEDRVWRHNIISLGRALIMQFLDLINQRSLS